MSLILGTVQFGTKYGVTSQTGQPSLDDSFAVINAAWASGIRILDSAQGYGEANKVIAEYHARHKNRFSVINKVMRHPQAPQDVLDSLRRERDQMDIEKFGCIMFHHASSVSSEFPDTFLNDLKSVGLTDRVGLSIDTPDQYDLLKDRFQFDIVQLPLNLMSQKFMPEEFLSELKKNNVEIHARSAFLQGVLLSKDADIPSYLGPIKGKIHSFQTQGQSLGFSPLTGCLLFLLQKSAIDRIVVGAQSAAQLLEIVAAYKNAEQAKVQGKNMEWGDFSADDFAMVHPLTWLTLAKNSQGK